MYVQNYQQRCSGITFLFFFSRGVILECYKEGPLLGALFPRDFVFVLEATELLLLLLLVDLPLELLRLVVDDDEVAILDVEAGKVLAGVLCVEYVLVHHVSRPLSVLRHSPAISCLLLFINKEEKKNICSLTSEAHSRICRIGPYLPNKLYISSVDMLKGKFRT